MRRGATGALKKSFLVYSREITSRKFLVSIGTTKVNCVLMLLVVCLGFSAVAMSTAMDTPYRVAAESTSRWIDWQAENCSATGGCVWPMNTTEPCCGHEHTLYYGPPGIALFYLQLASAQRGQPSRSKDYLHSTSMALAAGRRMQVTLRNALQTFGNNTAFYYGAAGLAFAFRQLHMANESLALGWQLDDGNFLASAHEVEDHIVREAKTANPGGAGITWSNNTDVAHGAAGTGMTRTIIYAHTNALS